MWHSVANMLNETLAGGLTDDHVAAKAMRMVYPRRLPCLYNAVTNSEHAGPVILASAVTHSQQYTLLQGCSKQ